MRDRILIVLYLAFAALPVTAMVVGIPDVRIFGVFEKPTRPPVAFDTIASEKYQHAFTAWFEAHLGLKGRAIRIDGTILGRVFEETKADGYVAIAGDVLFHREDVNGLNRTAAQIPTRESVLAIVSRMKTLQQRMRAKGRLFIPVLIPSKTTVYRDSLPERWQRFDGQYPADALYPLMKRTLDEAGVDYVDSAPMMATPTRELAWLPSARHWSRIPACQAIREVLARFTQMRGVDSIPYSCDNIVQKKLFPHFDDFDLWELLNARMPRPKPRAPIVVHSEPPLPSPPAMLVLGTSFCWTLIKDAAESNAFSRLYLDYYNQTFFKMPGLVASKVERGTPHYAEVMLPNDIYVLDVFETYMPLGPEILDDLAGLVDQMEPR